MEIRAASRHATSCRNYTTGFRARIRELRWCITSPVRRLLTCHLRVTDALAIELLVGVHYNRHLQ